MNLTHLTSVYHKPVWVGVCVSLAALGFYIGTLSPGVLWGDDAKFQLMAFQQELVADEISHPLYIALASLLTHVPVGQIAWRVNLTSAIVASIAIFFVYLSGWELTRDVSAGLAAAFAFAVSHTFWSFAVRAQAHALNAAFIAVLVWGALRWRGSLIQLAALAFMFGLGMTNHFLLGFSVFALAWWIVARARAMHIAWPRLLASALMMPLGFAPYLLLGLQQGTSTRSIGATSYLLGLATIQTPLRDLILWLGFLSYNFAGLAFILAFLGAIALWNKQRTHFVGLALLYLANAGFVFDLDLPDQYKYYIPSYLAFSLFVAPGFLTLRDRLAPYRLRARVFAAMLLGLCAVPLLTYHFTPQLLRAAGVDSLLGARNLPGRDAVVFFLQPSKHGYYGAEQYAESAFAQAAPGAALAGDHTTIQTLRFMQVAEGARPDITLVTLPDNDQVATLRQLAHERPVYLSDVQKYFDMEHIHEVFEVEPQGVLYRLYPRDSSTKLAPLAAAY